MRSKSMSVHISVFRTRTNSLAAHVVTEKIYNAMFWTNRLLMDYGNHDVYIASQRDVPEKEAKRVSRAAFDRWSEAGSPSPYKIARAIKENQRRGIGG